MTNAVGSVLLADDCCQLPGCTRRVVATVEIGARPLAHGRFVKGKPRRPDYSPHGHRLLDRLVASGRGRRARMAKASG